MNHRLFHAIAGNLGPRETLAGGLWVLAVLVLGTVLYLQRAPHRQAEQYRQKELRVQEAIGYRVGRAVAEAFPQGGEVLVLLDDWSDVPPRQGRNAARWNGLRRALSTANLRAVLVAHAPASDAEADEMRLEWPQRGVPAARLRVWCAERPSAVAVASFVAVDAAALAAGNHGLPALFCAVVPEGADWRRWLQRGEVRGVVLTRPDFRWEDVAGENAGWERVFEACCIWASAETLRQLPAELREEGS